MIKNCLICNKEIYISRWELLRKKYCSKECQNIGRWKFNAHPKGMQGKPAWNKKPEIFKNCIVCSKKFKVHFYRRNIAKFCSRKCAESTLFKKGMMPYNKNKKRPDLSGEKSHLWRGGKPKCLNCGKIIRYDNKTNKCEKCGGKLRIGENNHFWKGGITPLYRILREGDLSYQWRKQIFERDNYACKECGDSKGHNLNAHHIKPFNFLFKEFLQQYNQFSPIEDKEILARLAISFESFWNIDNGQTLCEDCHKKIHSKIRMEV